LKIFNISGIERAFVKIFDTAGRELFSGNEAKCPEVIDMTGFKKGIYLLKVKEGEDVSFHKLILN